MAIRDAFTRPRNWAAGTAILLAAIVEASLWIPGFYDELVAWQTGIAAVLGFGALITAALFNAELNRRRDDDLAQRARERDEERKARERFELALVLRTEIATVTILLGIPRNLITKLKSRRENRDLTVPEILIRVGLDFPAPTPVLERMVDRLGDLTPGVGTVIVSWYHTVEQLRWAPSLLYRQDGRVNLSRADIEFLLSVMDSLESLAETALERLSHDLDNLASRYGWPSPATDPAADAAVDLAAARKRRQEAVDLPGEGEGHGARPTPSDEATE